MKNLPMRAGVFPLIDHICLHETVYLLMCEEIKHLQIPLQECVEPQPDINFKDTVQH